MQFDLENAGKQIGKIKVEISYNIIELFSKGLYSSTNKAFEELICNSYDARATKVAIYIPDDISTTEYIWVLDNGTGMNAKGLENLWKVGTSDKRKGEEDLLRISKRKMIGKFGIGKLATYILTNKLTYLCKSEEGYFATTMDYGKLPSAGLKGLELSERRLSEAEAKDLINSYMPTGARKLIPFDLFGNSSVPTWTYCLMTSLKPDAAKIERGRLQWILRTALPMNPNFELHFNGIKLEPSKINIPEVMSWKMGSKEDRASFEKKSIATREENGEYYVDLAHLKNIRGEATLYKESLSAGKSADLGRSNGIFLMVRERLINIDEPLLGLAPLQHGAFARTRIIVHADELDTYLTSGRESIQNGPAFTDLKEYLNSFFYSNIRPRWDEEIKELDKGELTFSKLANSSASLVRTPLGIVVKKVAADGFNILLLNKLEATLAKDEKYQESFNQEIITEQGFVQNLKREFLGPENPVAVLDYQEKIVRINIAHPFIASIQEHSRDSSIADTIAIAEILTEAQLLELGHSQEEVRQMMSKRDRTLRTLSYSDRKTAINLAIMLEDAIRGEKELEHIVCDSFASLGYQVTPISGSGEPDGLASAYLGYSNNINKNYKIVLDGKSTKRKSVKTSNVHTDTSLVHKQKYNADFVVIVGIDFDGSDDKDSLICKEAEMGKVTIMKARDLSRLLLLSSPKMLTLEDLRMMLRTCHTPIEVTEWINKLELRSVNIAIIKPFVDTVWEMQCDTADTEPPIFGAIRQKMKAKMKDEYQQIKVEDISIENLKAYAASIQRLVPGFISIENDTIMLSVPPEKIYSKMHDSIHQAPTQYDDVYEVFKALSTSY